ncbi:S8 family serine peptidase [Ornithinimicrobium cerasi]|uniref:PA domain-containing protein n=1 Tax=Ornithinimicrobium cerasi TaxID=2248773 RepID=A0A285VIC5_9MICO|nr:S8 family serine peptidase [Ornithinimicrobium cerasi]SOC53743.1 PA domain-containing protein [Ornithinimicrobium cerasi]
MTRVRAPRRLALLLAGTLALTMASAPAGSATDPPAPPDDWTATALTPDGPVIHAPLSASGAMATSDEDLLARTDAEVVPVMVKLDLDGAASYAGGKDGLAPTSPQVTGRALADNAAAVEPYLAHAEEVTAEAATAVVGSVPAAVVTGSYEVAYGGLSALVPANRAKDLLKVPGVVAVQADEAREIQTDASPEFIGATEVWPSLGGSSTAGEGVVVGVLDSGIWPEHPSFLDPGIDRPDVGELGCEFGDGTDPALGDAFECNDKMLGAYAFLDTNVLVTGDIADDYCSGTECTARDDNGHGTHTASTAAGSPVEEAVVLGVDRGPVSGIAPGASVVMYRVCRPSCYSSDSVNAVQQAIIDGVDVLNFSISGGSDPYNDPVELSFLDATAAGISVNASAGNNGPAAATANHAGPWVTTVAASTSDRHFRTDVVLTADNGDTYTKVGDTVTDGITDTEVIHVTEVTPADPLCLTPLPEGSVAGKVVVCDRGVNARVDKGYNVLQGGAAGMILLNLVTQGTQTDNHWLPTAHLDGPNDEFKDFLATHTGVTASWGAGEPREVRGDVMAGFSSRGPLGPVLKPDVTAPGVQILAGHTPTPNTISSGPPGELFQAIAGTSMSSPHAAGSAALLTAAHPDWSPSEIKSALMMTSVQDVLEEDGVTATDPFDRGAGSIRVDRAADPTLVMDVSAEDFYAAAAGSLEAVDLNLASIYVDPLPGLVTLERTVRNVSGQTQRFDALVSADPGVVVSVSPKNPVVEAGASLTLTVTIDTTAADAGWRFGQITLAPKARGYAAAVLPLAVNAVDGDLRLTHSCEPTEITRSGLAECTATLTNLGASDAEVTASLTAPKKVVISDVSAPATPTSDGWVFEGTIAGALAPTIDSITEGGLFGYVPLASFGIAPIAGVGDESIVNYNVPAFQFGSETYTRLGVTSNGYAVVGGGSGSDVQFDPPGIPDGAAPNNVLAPLWTDLNPADGGALRIATLGDGVSTWLVTEWSEVPAYGTTQANSFQTWILLGGTEEVTFAYGTVQGTGPNAWQMGAENRDGSSGATLPLTDPVDATDTDWTVNTSPPVAGEELTITYSASSRFVGTYPLRLEVSTPDRRTTIADVVNLVVVR